MNTSETITELAPALVEAIGSIEGATKGALNDHFKRNYADLTSVIEASRAALHVNGLAVLQSVGGIVEGRVHITTRIIHKSGQWIESTCQVPLHKSDAQGLGSATTYGRRYGLMAMLNIPAIDDDGNAACEPAKPVPPPVRQALPAPDNAEAVRKIEDAVTRVDSLEKAEQLRDHVKKRGGLFERLDSDGDTETADRLEGRINHLIATFRGHSASADAMAYGDDPFPGDR